MPRKIAYNEVYLMDMIEMKTKYKRNIIRDIVEAYNEFLLIALDEIEIVRIKNVGTYRIKEYPERMRSMPKTQELRKYPARRVVTFTYDQGGAKLKKKPKSQLKK